MTIALEGFWNVASTLSVATEVAGAVNTVEAIGAMEDRGSVESGCRVPVTMAAVEEDNVIHAASNFSRTDIQVYMIMSGRILCRILSCRRLLCA